MRRLIAYHVVAFALQSASVQAVIDKLTPQSVDRHGSSTINENSYHIFNSIHACLRTWDSARNHNGMTFFHVTIPPGIDLFHGRKDNQTVKGMEWLSFDPAFAYAFTGTIYPLNCQKGPMEEPLPSQHGRDPSRRQHNLPVGEHETESVMPFGQTHQSLSQSPEGDKLLMSQGQNRQKSQTLETGSDEEEVDANARPKSTPCPPRHYEPGYLHTYTTRKSLNVLYVDGMSGAKSSLGTLDTQDRILRGLPPDWAPPSDQRIEEDYHRANDICKLARTKWQNKIDGILRQNTVRELILCDFETGVERTSMVKAEETDILSPYVPAGIKWMVLFDAFRGIADNYFGREGDRVEVDHENFVTLYAFDSLKLWPNGINEHPRLTELKDSEIDWVFGNVTEMILGKPEDGLEDAALRTNWQIVTDMIVTKYAKYLQDLAYGAESYFDEPALLHKSIELVVRPFIDFNHRNRTLEVHQCATQFFPHAYRPSVAAKAVYHVSAEICSTMLSVEATTANLQSMHPGRPTGASLMETLETQNALLSIREEFRALHAKVSWPIHKYCPGRCRTDEICFTPVTPVGAEEDFEKPNCKDFRTVGSMNGTYWNKDAHR